ncbi:hypothetical protein RUND412_003996 [Rhizina undulata]
MLQRQWCLRTKPLAERVGDIRRIIEATLGGDPGLVPVDMGSPYPPHFKLFANNGQTSRVNAELKPGRWIVAKDIWEMPRNYDSGKKCGRGGSEAR